MQQIQTRIQKNILLAILLCIAMSSITLGCDTCQNKALQKDKLTIELIPAGDITQQALAIITLKKTAGYTNLGDLILTFTDHAKFVKEDGTALAATMKLSELLGQEATTGMESEITLKVKAATATATANVDAQLKIAVGNSGDAGAYVSETVAVTWKAAPLTFTVDKQIIHNTDKTATITITKTPGTPSLQYGEVFLTFSVSGTGACLNHFQQSGGTALNASKLSSFLSGIAPTDPIPDGTPIIIKVEGCIGYGIGYVLQGEKLNLSIGKSATDATCYVPLTPVVTWQNTYKITSTGVTSINGMVVGDCKFNNASTLNIPHNQLQLIFTGATDFFEGVGGVDLAAGPILNTILGGGPIATSSDFVIKFKAKGAGVKGLLTPKINEILDLARTAAKTAATGVDMAGVAGQAVIDATPTTGTANQKAVAKVINNAIVAAGTTAGAGVGVNSADETTRNDAIDAAIYGFYNPLDPGFVINYPLLLNTASELLKLAGGVKKTLAVEIRDAGDPTIVYMPSTQILTWEIL